MTETFSLYVIDEEKLPSEFSGQTDQDVYDQLVRAIEADGVLCGSIRRARMTSSTLESVDGHIGKGQQISIAPFQQLALQRPGKQWRLSVHGLFQPCTGAGDVRLVRVLAA